MKKQIIIQKFDGGIAGDIREQSVNKFAILKHFDIYSNPSKLTPQFNTEADTATSVNATDLKQYDVRNFRLASNGNFYALGIQPAAPTKLKILYKDINDIAGGNWTKPATAEGTTANSDGWRESFMDFGTTPKFYGFAGTNEIWAWTIGGAWNDAVGTVGTTITHVAQSVKAADDNMYMFYNNKVVRVTPGGTTTDNVLALPPNGRITSACAYGNFLAIAWAQGTTLNYSATNLVTEGSSKVFIWDMVSADVSEVIDWGEGQLMILDIIDGRLVGISDVRGSSTLGLYKGFVITRMYSGGVPVTINQIQQTSLGTPGWLLLRNKVVRDNRLYFAGIIPFYDSSSTATSHIGIYSIGRRDSDSPYVLNLEIVEPNVDTTSSYANYRLNSFGSAGGYWFINHSADGSVTKTNNELTYTSTSIMETVKYNCGDISRNKRLVGVAVSCAPLPTAGVIHLYYKKDSDTVYTEITPTAGITADNTVSFESILDTHGKNLPEFHEIQFKVTSYGGAEITGLKFVYEEKDTLLNLK